MEILIVCAFLFVFGLAIGSFLNVVIYRVIHGDSPMRGRSYCDNCKKLIPWYDNIPLFSFLVLKRKCRYCKTPISWTYPAIELLTGLLFVWWYLVGFTFFRLTATPFTLVQPLFWLAVALLLLVIFATDLFSFLIPDSAVYLLTILAFSYRIALTVRHIMTISDFWVYLASAIACSVFFYLLVLLTHHKGMGLGDVKLVFPLGLLVGWPLLLFVIMLASIAGSIVGITTIVVGAKNLKSKLPFGPFLIGATCVALLWGDHILSFYSKLAL
ncbi:MAG TPA: prepilin peptidase [Patescibacteria group bacterium]|nr:prepilin peptidase [Patescibacteria group bacterium]